MKRWSRYLLLIVIIMALSVMLWYFLPQEHTAQLQGCAVQSRLPKIKPDYTDTVIPPNIAPLNFVISEPGTKYFVRIRSTQGQNIEIFSKKPQIIIPAGRWRQLLNANRSNQLFFDVYVKDANDRWLQYQTITNTITSDEIDPYVVYRLMEPTYAIWGDLGVYQRNLENYDESVVLHGSSFERGCVNCHTFLNNRPESMVIGVRGKSRMAKKGSGTILVNHSKVNKIGTNFGYTAWHPSGKLLTYSITNVVQFFHTTGAEVRDVLDIDSALAYYLVDSQTIKTNPAFSNKKYLETYPTWSPDGRYLYFCTTPLLWSAPDKVSPEHYKKVKYDLVRVSYDVKTDQWGQLETILSATETGLSILLPRISPDGRFLLFCMCRYSCFATFQPTSDLYLMDTETARYRKLEVISSEQSESWHCWSSNSRWIVFSSKRPEGVFNRLYISYFDKTGKVYKPFILPQKDPTFYDSFIKTYTLPELVTGPVAVGQRKLVRAVRSSDEIVVELPITSATPKAAGTQPDYSWQHRHE